VKCSVVERDHRTIRDRLYKYFYYKNMYRYIDVLLNFVKAYNDTVHTTTGMAPSRASDSDVVIKWKRLVEKKSSIRVIRLRFRVGQHVRISKEKMKLANGAEPNFSTEIFRVVKVIDMWPRPVYELEDLNRTPIDGHFYKEELTPVRVTKNTVYKIDKILDERVRRGIREYFFRWRWYSGEFNSWVPASSIKNVRQ